MSPYRVLSRWVWVVAFASCGLLRAQSAAPVSVTVDASQRFQTIMGFGTALGSDTPVWTSSFQQMYTQDLGASLLRVPLTPDIVPSQITFGPDLQSNINLMNFYGNYPHGGLAQYAITNARRRG